MSNFFLRIICTILGHNWFKLKSYYTSYGNSLNYSYSLGLDSASCVNSSSYLCVKCGVREKQLRKCTGIVDSRGKEILVREKL